jgi:telomere length regulation protein
MADFLTAISTKKVKSPEPLLQEIKSLRVQDVVEVDSASSALEALKKQPGRETITNTLNYMTSDGFSLLLPEPLNASIAYQLINDTIPHYWRPLKGSSQRKLFARILRNPLGVGHVITRLRSLIADSRQKKAPDNARDPAEHIEELLELLEAILHGDETCVQVSRDIQAYGKNSTQKKLLWREYLAQAVSGRLIAIVAEAEDVLKTQTTSRTASWIADGSAYAKWLGRNMATLIREEGMGEEQASIPVELYSKALSLGYTGKRPAFADLNVVG